MIEKIYLYTKKYRMLEDCSTVIVGLSGGADSVCLLMVLYRLINVYKLGVKLVAVHVNHGIRGAEAARDETFSRKLCETLGITFESVRVDVPNMAKTKGLTEEEAGRMVRYEAFDFYASKYNASRIAVAHHMDDQAETVLMNIFRGSSLRGAGGIQPVRDNIIRPLLCVSRQEIEDYLSKNNQEYVTDSTNGDNLYTRNRLRNELLPYIKQNFNENVVEQLSGMAEEFAAASEYIRQQAESLGMNCVRYQDMHEDIHDDMHEDIHKDLHDDMHVDIHKDACENMHVVESDSRANNPKVIGRKVIITKQSFNEAHIVIKKQIIADVLAELAGARKDIYRSHIEAVIEVFDMQVGKKINLPYGIICTKTYDSVVLTKVTALKDACCKEKKNLEPAGKEDNFSKLQNWTVDLPKQRLDELMGNPVGTKLELPIGKYIYSNNGRKVFAEYIVLENAENYLKFGNNDYTKYFDYDKIKSNICFRFRNLGDKIVISSDGKSRKLKKEFIDRKISSEQRDNILLLAEADSILWAVGVRRSEACLVDSVSKRILKLSVIIKDTERDD